MQNPYVSPKEAKTNLPLFFKFISLLLSIACTIYKVSSRPAFDNVTPANPARRFLPTQLMMAVYFIFQIIWNGAKFFCGRQFLNSTRYQDQCFPVAWNYTSPLFPNCTSGPPKTLQEAMNNTLCMYVENLPNTSPVVIFFSNEVSIIFICIYALIFLLGVPGNAMVCIVLGKAFHLNSFHRNFKLPR